MECSGLCFGKCNWRSLKNSFPMFVTTFLLCGRLYHTTLLLRCLVGRDTIFWSESYISSLSYPASPRACWYTVLASLSTSSELVIVFYLFWMELGMFFGMDGGRLDDLFTYLRLLLSFLYGLYVPSVDIVTSRKLTVWPACSILIFSWFRLKMRCKAFSILEMRGPFAFSR